MNEQRIRAPELPDDLQWFNTATPLKLADQRGKVVVLDFWTYCCINCLHVLPDLRYLEDKYPDGLTVIGVHSPKFPNERIDAQVQKAINRYHVRHPVVNDPGLRMWKQYGIRAWPSMIFIDPEGYVVGVLRGEGRRHQLDMLIAEHLEKAEAKGVRRAARTPVQPTPEPRTTLRFPGKILATGNRLFIADTGHNRIVEAGLDGRVKRFFGSTGPGFVDGQGQDAAFRNPQGMAKVEDFLFVADTDNHAIRRIHLHSGDVQTVAGNGRQATRPGTSGLVDPLQTPLNSPWDLVYGGGRLYIAMAGQHQIWVMNLTDNTLTSFVGSGQEDLVDGSAESAALAQPSALVLDEFQLFVVDSETSAVRAVRLPDGQVRTLIGAGLFEFGDQDGVGKAARLQHPLGAAFDASRFCLWIADTYNSKIKRLDLKSKQISTFGACPGLDEPSGLSLHEGSIWIANTNAHAVVHMELPSGRCETIDIHE